MIKLLLINLIFFSKLCFSSEDYELIDIQSNFKTSLQEIAKKYNYLVIIAEGNNCPVFSYYVPTINFIQEKYSTKGVGLIVINSFPNRNFKKLSENVKKLDLIPKNYVDTNQLISKKFNITTVSEAIFLETKKLTVLYKGAIDDRVKFHNNLRVAKNNYLTDAIDETLAGKSVTIKSMRPYGCFVTKPN